MTHDEVRAFLRRRIRAWEEEDLGAIIADYAPDIVHTSPGGRRVGVAAMRETNARYLAEYTAFTAELTRLLVDGDQVAIEWTWGETRRADGRRRSVDDAIIFVLRDWQIVSWREYFDTAAFV